MSRLSGRVVGAAVAALSLLAMPGLVAAGAAYDRPVPPSVACGTLDLWAAGAPGTRVSTIAKLGSTTATLKGTIADAWGLRALGSPTLTVVEGRRTARSGPVEVPADWAGPPATILTTGIARPSPSGPGGDDAVLPLCVAWFAGSRHPTALLGLYTGGAHCCTILRAYPLTDRGAGAAVDHWIGNPGVDVRSDRGRAIVVTADDAFNYEFNAFAFSGVPLKVLELRTGGFVDTTREHLDLVRNDATQWWQSFEKDPSQGLGSLAAWVADQCLLGEGPNAWSTVDRLLAEGKLAGPPDPGELWPSGADYVAKLHTFLPEHGYCR